MGSAFSKTKTREEKERLLIDYIRKGECREAFDDFNNCLDDHEARKKEERDSDSDSDNKCKEYYGKLTDCMKKNHIYYEPILEAQRSLENIFTAFGEKVKEKLTKEVLDEESIVEIFDDAVDSVNKKD